MHSSRTAISNKGSARLNLFELIIFKRLQRTMFKYSLFLGEIWSKVFH